MNSSRTPVRRRSLATLLVVAAALAALVLPAAASADHQAQLAATSTVAPGCLPKGVFAQPAPSGPGGLPPGTYAYVIVATINGIDVTPCPPAFTSLPGGPLNSVSLQWNAAPNATGYK